MGTVTAGEGEEKKSRKIRSGVWRFSGAAAQEKVKLGRGLEEESRHLQCWGLFERTKLGIASGCTGRKEGEEARDHSALQLRV